MRKTDPGTRNHYFYGTVDEYIIRIVSEKAIKIIIFSAKIVVTCSLSTKLKPRQLRGKTIWLNLTFHENDLSSKNE